MENGFTSQFTNSVTISPRGLLPTLRMEAKSTFIIIGMIISQIRTAIGTLIWLPFAELQAPHVVDRAGCQLPAATPATMQSPTHRLRYRSNTFSRLGAAATDAWTIYGLLLPALIRAGDSGQQQRTPGTFHLILAVHFNLFREGFLTLLVMMARLFAAPQHRRPQAIRRVRGAS